MTVDPGSDANASGGRAEIRELERQLEEARAKLREAEERAVESLDRWQRAQADLANFRRRTQFEREQEQRFGSLPLIEDVTRVVDGFERAWKSLPTSLRTFSWIEGVWLVDRQLRATLERLGVREIEALGKPFDPHLHQAVVSDPGDHSDTVVEVLQAGYQMHDRVVRPSLVRVGVASAPPPLPMDEGTSEAVDDRTAEVADDVTEVSPRE